MSNVSRSNITGDQLATTMQLRNSTVHVATQVVITLFRKKSRQNFCCSDCNVCLSKEEWCLQDLNVITLTLILHESSMACWECQQEDESNRDSGHHDHSSLVRFCKEVTTHDSSIWWRWYFLFAIADSRSSSRTVMKRKTKKWKLPFSLTLVIQDMIRYWLISLSLQRQWY